MRLKKEARQHLQGAMLLLISYVCHKIGSDGASIIMLICGLVMLFGEDESRSNN